MFKRVDFWLWSAAASVFAGGGLKSLIGQDWAGVALGVFGLVGFGFIAIRYRRSPHA